LQPRVRGLLGNAALALASTLLGLLALEVGLRLLPERPTKNRLYLYSRFDPQLGWAKLPGAAARFELREYSVDMRINDKGLRDRPREYAPPPGAQRVLALGDSFTEALGVPEERGWTRVLETGLRQQGCAGAEVVNGGTSGYSTDQEYLFYSNEGSRYGASVVVLTFFYNDVLQNVDARLFRRAKPLFVLDGDRLVLSNTPLPPPAPEAAPANEPSDESPSFGGSATLRFFETRLRHGAPSLHTRIAALGLWPALEAGETPRVFKVYRRRPIPEVSDAWRTTRALLRDLNADVQRRGARLLVVYVPHRLEVNQATWQRFSLMLGWNEANTERAGLARRLREIARDVGFELLDLTPALQQADRSWGSGPYYLQDEHWTVAGHRTAAREIQRVLRGPGWLRCAGGAD
jgi:lysophospholipase L1-like esterase